MSKSEIETKRRAAVAAFGVFFAAVIREEIEDPDHSGPEDAGDILADSVVDAGYYFLTTMDWHDLFDQTPLLYLKESR